MALLPTKLNGPDEKSIQFNGNPRFVNELGKRSFQRFIGMCGDLHIVKYQRTRNRSIVDSALVKQASDRRIIDPARTSHVQKKANVFR